MATLEVESMFVQSIENTASSAAVALTGGTRMESRRYANRPHSGVRILTEPEQRVCVFDISGPAGRVLGEFALFGVGRCRAAPQCGTEDVSAETRHLGCTHTVRRNS